MSTSHRNIFGHLISPSLTLTFGVGIGIILICGSFQNSAGKPIITKQSPRFEFVTKFIWMFGFVYALIHSYKYFDRWMIDLDNPKYSDVIPQIGYLVRRLLNGEYPYQIIDFGGHQLFPTYQPFQWLPYIFAEVGNFDYRFISFFVLSISLLLFQFILLKSSITKIYKICFSIYPWLLLILFINSGKHEYAITVENLIAAYYLFFVFAIFTKSIFIKSLTTVLCLLSRYTLVLWLPLYCIMIFLENKREATKYVGLILSGILLFYVFPFMIQDPLILKKGFDYHTTAAIDLWKLVDGKPPPGLFQGLGLSSFFYQFIDGDHIAKLTAIKIGHLTITASCVVVSIILFIKKRNRIQNKGLFALGSFKVYITLFYSFIQIPFNYLFIVSLYISLFCAFKLLENSIEG